MKIIKIIFCLFICVILILYVDNNLENSNNNILSYVINNKEKNNAKTLYKIMNILIKKDAIDPLLVLNNNKTHIEEEQVNEVITNKNEPVVYLYSTHQTEEYQKLDNQLYNFIPTVTTASYILEELLEEKGINVIVEERNIKKVLNDRGWDYSYSYRISREYMEDSIIKYPTLTYFIDIHRDGVSSKNIVTAKINEKNYAKLMFLIGTNRKNYKENEKIIKTLEKGLEESYKGITRNTYYQKSYSYNQDFSDNTFLIEVGASQNTIDEVYNSMEALSNILAKYIKGEL